MSARPAAWLATLALTAAIAPAGCGGGGEGQTSTATSPPKQPTTAEEKAPQDKKKSAEPKPEEQRQRTAEGAPTPGSKAVAPGVPVAKGGDNSIQSFGAEGQEDQREQATATLRAYLSALRAEEWAKACAETSREFKRNLAEFVAQAGDKTKGCTATLQRFTSGPARAALRAVSQIGEVLSFRVRGEYAYLIFKGAKGAAMFIALADDSGEWKVNVLRPEPFSTGSRQ